MSMIHCPNCKEINPISMVKCIKCGANLQQSMLFKKKCKKCYGYKKCYYNELYDYTRNFCLKKDKIFWEKGE